jgi:hypothetical protein
VIDCRWLARFSNPVINVSRIEFTGLKVFFLIERLILTFSSIDLNCLLNLSDTVLTYITSVYFCYWFFDRQRKCHVCLVIFTASKHYFCWTNRSSTLILLG